MKLLEETPILRNQVVQKMIAAGVRQGAVGGAQEFVHSGGDPVAALKTGAIAGAAGGALEGLSSGIVEPKTKAFAEEDRKRRDSRKRCVATVGCGRCRWYCWDCCR